MLSHFGGHGNRNLPVVAKNVDPFARGWLAIVTVPGQQRLDAIESHLSSSALLNGECMRTLGGTVGTMPTSSIDIPRNTGDDKAAISRTKIVTDDPKSAHLAVDGLGLPTAGRLNGRRARLGLD